MTFTDHAATLRDAASIIRAGWCIGAPARCQGVALETALDPSATAYCATGALHLATHHRGGQDLDYLDIRAQVDSLLRRHRHITDLVAYNDSVAPNSEAVEAILRWAADQLEHRPQ